MALRFPKANTWFQAYTDTDFLTAAQHIHDTFNIGVFAAPPVTLAALQTLIDNYAAALALATGPGAGVLNTKNKDAAKLALKNGLRQNCQYVNQEIVGMIAGGTTYIDAEALITGASGYQLSKQPVPAGPLPPVILRKYGSYTKGQFYILIEKIVNAKGYVVRVADITTGTNAFDISFPSTRMNIISGLMSGHEYTFAIAAIGANPTRDFSTQITGQFIL